MKSEYPDHPGISILVRTPKEVQGGSTTRMPMV